MNLRLLADLGGDKSVRKPHAVTRLFRPCFRGNVHLPECQCLKRDVHLHHEVKTRVLFLTLTCKPRMRGQVISEFADIRSQSNKLLELAGGSKPLNCNRKENHKHSGLFSLRLKCNWQAEICRFVQVITLHAQFVCLHRSMSLTGPWSLSHKYRKENGLWWLSHVWLLLREFYPSSYLLQWLVSLNFTSTSHISGYETGVLLWC